MMKYGTLFFCVVLGCSIALADVFASRIKITNPDGSPFDGTVTGGKGMKISYSLNDTATAVQVLVKDAGNGQTVATINSGAQSSGERSVTWNGSGAAVGKKYYVTITATQTAYSATDYKVFKWIQSGEAIGDPSRGIFSRGVDASRNPAVKNFGYLYGANNDAGSNLGYKTGIIRFNPNATFAGTDSGHPILTQTLGAANGGTFDYTGVQPWYSTVDNAGRIFYSGNGTVGKVYMMKDDASVPKKLVDSLNNPRGLATVRTGNSTTLYIASDTVVYRTTVGTDSLTSALQVIATFGLYIRDLIVDDAGQLIVALRAGAAGSAPGKLVRFDLSGTLPKRLGDGVEFSTFAAGLPIGLAIHRGPNKTSVSDDTLYVSVRGGGAADMGIYRITALDGFTEQIHVFNPNTFAPPSAGGNISTNADMTVDYAGNLILFENGNEEIFMISPPHTAATHSVMTPGADSVLVSSITGVGNGSISPTDFVLNQNYPNPFNPTTMISYSLPVNGSVTVTVYDVLGNVVSELFRGNVQQGYNAVVWNGTSSGGTKVASGMYLYRVSAQLQDGRSFSDTKRMMLLK